MLTSEISALYNEFNEDSGGGDSGNTGFLIDGLFLSSSKPKLGQKGLLIDSKYFIPFAGSGGSAEYYRCASVETSAKTWTGYRAVLNEGVYTFEDTVTTGLSYTSVTPQVGKIYSQDASVGVNYLSGQAPTYGLKFYASLKNSFTPETGQEFHSSLCVNLDQVEFANSGGIPGAVFPASETHAFYDAVENYTAPMSVSFWAKSGGNDNYVALRRVASNSLSSDKGAIYFTLTGQDIRTTEAQCSTFITSETNTTDAWHHYCYTQSLTTARVYKDGILLNEQTYSFEYTSGRIYLSINSSGGGLMSSVRIYNRDLTEEEVQLLASEFAPTQVNA